MDALLAERDRLVALDALDALDALAALDVVVVVVGAAGAIVLSNRSDRDRLGLDLSGDEDVTAQELLSPRRLQEILGVLADAGLPAQCLTIEVLESVPSDEEGAIGAALLEYSRSGMCLALDDFGLDLPAGCAPGPDRGPQGRPRVRGRHRGVAAGRGDRARHPLLTDDLGLRCVAEGVEEGHQRAWLAGHGVGFAQGFPLHRPLPADQMTALLNDLGRPPDG